MPSISNVSTLGIDLATNRFGITFHHFGLAVRSPGRAFLFLKALGYREGPTEYDPLQAVNLAMLDHPDMPDVEVIWPGDGPSPIGALLKRSDALVYHLCYVTDDAALTVSAIEAAGLSVMQVAEPKPAILFGGLYVSFHYVEGYGLIELIHAAPAATSDVMS